MTARSPSHPRPLSSALPSPQIAAPTRKLSLDHGDCWRTTEGSMADALHELTSRGVAAAPPPQKVALSRKLSLDHRDCWRTTERSASDLLQERTPREMTAAPPPQKDEESKDNKENVDVNHNGPSIERKDTMCKRKVLKKQTSLESIGCDEYYFYDFFDRNGRPPTPAQSTSEDPPPAGPPPSSVVTSCCTENQANNNVEPSSSRVETHCSGATSKLRRNMNSVRPKSWLQTSSSKAEDTRRVRRRQTDPCGRDFLSNYERALSSLLYQPYDCRNDGPSTSTTVTTFDDSDVNYWLGPNPKRWRERERRSVGEFCSFQNDSSDSSSRSSISSSSSSLGEYMRRKPWGDNKDPSSSSIRALLLTDWKTGNAAESSDLDASLPRDPPGALPTGWTSAQTQCVAGHGREMLVSVTESTSAGGSQSNLLAATGSAGCSGSAEDGVSVSCYRAVPATVSAVPVIPCNNVSNVRIVQTTRTFTSTEAQTDDVIVAPGNPSREQRRRERRERRHQRRLLHPPHPHQTPDPTMWHTPMTEPMVDRLPDILNSHLPPPYSTMQVGLPPPPLPPHPPPMTVTAVPGSPPPQPGGLRFPFAIVPAGRRRSRLSPHFTPDDEPKSCCGVAVSQTLSIRWFIVLIFLVGICCAAVGTILGAMKATGREHLTVSLLMIGVGIVLVAVSGVAWRLTSQDAPSCRAMLGLGGDDSNGEPNRRFVPRLPPSYGRPHHPYAAMMYPEFQYRAPPPSYQASMQEYRLRLLLLDRHSGTPGNAASPPPTYRSHPGSLLRAPLGLRGREMHTPSQSEYSRPPSYRSRTSSRPDPASNHSREPSGSDNGQAVNVITVHPHIIKLAPSPPLPAKSGKDSNLVTIVQTTSESTGPVIVTISGQQDGTTSHCHDSEMEILAHL